MKCSKCGHVLNGKLCLTCGNENNYDYSINQTNKPINKKTNNYKLNGKSILIIVLCLIIVSSIIGGIVYFTRPKKIDLVIKYNAVEMLDKDFKNNKLSANDYVLYNAYSIYDYTRLPKKYQTNTFQFAPDINYLYAKYQNQLDSVTKEYIENKIYLKNIKLGSKANKDNVGYIPFVDKVNAEENMDKIIELDKAVASENVVIWYTTEGDSAISDQNAKDISNNIDTVINDLATEFGVPYKFKNQFQFTEEVKRSKEKKLSDLGISPDYINKLNVYIYNYGENSTTYGKYNYLFCQVQKDNQKCDTNEVRDDEIMGPYISLNSNNITNNINNRIIYTHELYHQLQANLASNGNFDISHPLSDENNDEDFTSETTANYAAAILNPEYYNDSYLNTQIYNSILNIKESINKMSGYYSFRFIKEYSDIVENGKSKARDSILYPNRIKYLYDEADDKFNEVIANYGINTLTNNYSVDSFKFKPSIQDGKKDHDIVLVPINNNCIESNCESIKPSAINYYKIKVSDYKDNEYIKLKSKDVENLNVQFVSAKQKNVFLDDEKEKFYSYDFKNKSSLYTLKTNEYIETSLKNYKDEDEIFIVISNGNIDKEGNYEIIINDQKEGTNEDLVTPVSNNKQSNNTTNTIPTKVYLNDKDLELYSFNYNWRTYVELGEFCKKVGCEVEKKDNKSIITRKITSLSTSAIGTYKIELDLNSSNYNSKLILNNSETDFWNLVQDNVSDKPCPQAKDRYGIDPTKTCNDTETYVPIRFIMQGLGYIVDWKPTDTENKVLLYDNVLSDFDNKGYRFVFTSNKTNENEIVTNIIETNNSNINLNKDTNYYIYIYS